MDAEAEAAEAGAPDGPQRTPFRASQLWLAVGLAIAAVTVLSGIAASIFQFHDDSEIQREVFVNIPGSFKLAFYTIVPVMLVWGSLQMSYRVRNWERGAPEHRTTNRKNLQRRLADFRAGIYMQTLMREPGAGLMHSLIYFNFVILLGVTTVLEINHQVPEDLKFLHGGVYKAYALIGDLAGIGFLAGMAIAIVRRYGPARWRPYRIAIKTRPEHAVILGVLTAIGVTGFGAEAFRIAVEGNPDYEQWSVIGYPLALAVDGVGNLEGWHQAWWVAHVFSFVAFLAIIPGTMMRHMFTSPLNMYLRDRERPEGGHAGHARPREHRARDLRGLDGRVVHLEAAARHRRLHDVWPLHLGVPGPRHRQAARPPRDRAQDRRGHGPNR